MDPAGGYALMGLSNIVRLVEFDTTGGRLLTGSTDGKARIWNLVTGQPMATFVGKPGFGKVKAHFLPDPRHLIIGSGNRFQVCDLSTGRVVTEATGRGTDHGWGFSRDGRRMFTASGEAPYSNPGYGHGTLEVWDLEETPRRILDRAGREPFGALALSPDDRTIACVGLDYCVHRWESFPWREDEYAKSEAHGACQKAEGRR
jgi:WD40 repeat protein